MATPDHESAPWEIEVEWGSPRAQETNAVEHRAEASPRPSQGGSGGWTIPILCAGIALVAVCLLIPASDENRRIAYEREHLKRDLEHLKQQVETNQEFLRRAGTDPALAERLAQRQMKLVREGTEVMQLPGHTGAKSMSPFLLVTLAPPEKLAEYRPVGGKLAQWCRQPRTRLYLLGGALFMMAAGVVLGHSRP